MPAKQQEKPPFEPAGQQPRELTATIGRQVLQALGQPGDLLHVQVRLLWEGHYRVNVFLGTGIASSRVAHSFFLVADGEGNILASAPEILKRY